MRFDKRIVASACRLVALRFCCCVGVRHLLLFMMYPFPAAAQVLRKRAASCALACDAAVERRAKRRGRSGHVRGTLPNELA